MIRFESLLAGVRGKLRDQVDERVLAEAVHATITELGLVVSEATGEVLGLAPRAPAWSPPEQRNVRYPGVRGERTEKRRR